jgi:hypothetical protein
MRSLVRPSLGQHEVRTAISRLFVATGRSGWIVVFRGDWLGGGEGFH